MPQVDYAEWEVQNPGLFTNNQELGPFLTDFGHFLRKKVTAHYRLFFSLAFFRGFWAIFWPKKQIADLRGPIFD